MAIKTPKASAPSFSELAPGGGPGPAAAPAQAAPKNPGGAGFLINHNAFSDAHPPAARGMKKSAGYPSFAKGH